MEWTRSGSDVFVRIDSAEEIHASLQKLADNIGFNAAAITSGIGRTRETIYGYMNEDGVYIRRKLDSPSELVSLSGNMLELKMVKHLHIFIVAGQMMIITFMPDICSSLLFM